MIYGIKGVVLFYSNIHICLFTFRTVYYGDIFQLSPKVKVREQRERERERENFSAHLILQPSAYLSWRYTLFGNDENDDNVDHYRGARISAMARHTRLSNMGISHGSQKKCIHEYNTTKFSIRIKETDFVWLRLWHHFLFPHPFGMLYNGKPHFS